MSEGIKATVVFNKQTPNYLYFESEDMDFREGGVKIKMWVPKTEIEPRGYVPQKLSVELGPPPAEIAQPDDGRQYNITDDDIPF